MDTRQTNKITMFKTVSAFLHDNNSVWRGMPKMVTEVQQFTDLISAIDLAAQKQETPITGVTMNKTDARDALEDVLFLICEALGALGYSENDRDLIALTALTPTSLGEMGAEDLSNRATTIVAQATAYTDGLATMNVTPANIDELQQALQRFNEVKASPRTATAVRMAQTESLSTLLRDASGVLRNQIDKMMNLFRRTNSDFVVGYRGARVIVDRAATRKTPPPTVVNTPTQANA